MDSLTKNKKSYEEIVDLLNRTVCSKFEVKEVVELDNGHFNAVYKICLFNGTEYVLKISPNDSINILRNEKNIICSEVLAINLVKSTGFVPVPKIVFFSEEKKYIDSSFIIMECLSGSNCQGKILNYSNEEKEQIFFDLGNLAYSLHKNTSSHFGTVNKTIKCDSWYHAFKSLLNNVLYDIEDANIKICYDSSAILKLYNNSKIYFDSVEVPCLIHGDLWLGNVMVNKKKISGIIDFERSIWGDPLMEFPFGLLSNNLNFIKGYGENNIDLTSDSAMIRRKFYNIYHYLTVKAENYYRGYNKKSTDYITDQKICFEIGYLKKFLNQ